MSRRLAIAVALILALGISAAAGYVHFAVPRVAVTAPVRGPAVEAIYATGVVEPVIWAKVTPMLRGRIMELCKCEGVTIGEGDVLARLDDAEERARVAELEARAEFLEGDMRRYARLLEGNHVSAQTYQRASSAYAEIRAVIAAERSRLNDFTIRAPIAGQVLRRDGEVGEIVDSDDVLFWVGEPKPLWIVAEVDEEDIARVRIGQRALIKADAFPSQVLDGTVETITPKGDPDQQELSRPRRSSRRHAAPHRHDHRDQHRRRDRRGGAAGSGRRGQGRAAVRRRRWPRAPDGGSRPASPRRPWCRSRTGSPRTSR